MAVPSRSLRGSTVVFFSPESREPFSLFHHSVLICHFDYIVSL